MADITREPWNDPSKNAIAQKPSRMEGTSVKPVLLVGTDGEPYNANGGSGPGPGGSTPNDGSSTIQSVTDVVSTLTMAVTTVELYATNTSSSASVYIGIGFSASTSNYSFKLNPGDTLILNTFNGDISFVADTGQTANVAVTQTAVV